MQVRRRGVKSGSPQLFARVAKERFTCGNVAPLYSVSTARTPRSFATLLAGPLRAEHEMVMSCAEANLPTEHPATKAQARLSRSDEDARRPRHPQGSAHQGTRPAIGLTDRARPGIIPKSLRSPRDFRRVLDAGSVARRGEVTTAVLARRPTDDITRLGLAVRTTGGSVGRNRVRRRLREAFLRCEPAPGYDVVVRADDRARDVTFRQLVDDLCGAIAM